MPSTAERLWVTYADRLLLYATSLVADRSTAEDVLQSVFARLLQSMPAYESEAGYLYRAVRNESLNTRRAQGRTPPPRLFETPDPATQASQREWVLRVESALQRLDAEEREAVVLKLWADLSFPDAAEVAGTTAKAIEHRYYRGLAALKETLKDE